MAQFYSAKQRVATKQRITVTIEDLDPFGQGVARHNGKAMFVSGALPGEQAEVMVVEDKRQFSRAKAKKIMQPSAQREKPRCVHFGVCGGCQQQHAAIALQEDSKARALSRMLSRDAPLPVQVNEIISGNTWGYRRRARLGLQWQPKQQRLQMGFRQAASNDLVELTQCPILVPELEALLQPLHQCLSSLQAARRLGHVELVLADNGPVMVLRHLDALSAGDRVKLERFSHEHQLMLYLADGSEHLQPLGDYAPFYQSFDLKLTFSPQDFIQVNDGVNQQMVTKAIEWLDLQPEDRVLDLFCGMGNFTLPVGKFVQNAVGVEGVAALVHQAAYNAELNNLKNVRFFQHNLEEDVAHQPWAAQGFNKVLLDPARAGAAGVMSHIVKLAPQRVVYVSCNPTTLARDSQALLSAGYHLERVAMLDMFPHTSHLESMVLFSKA
ncbi:23S rRNA (uracil(1939)-C(5))-methyltransferase RlmD [Pantoea sp. Taur]|jgi:23S rRNA (uracil1939-C5)-methyltransferase|uniref:23S rRNA (uracil(1939)-C(5))-methyltransferase RlmD n=1 Tax=Pantoea sp. Taur TaxID=2576757 RepID=UPI00073F888C|nr:23S rRNA (uracil(1939)-C(5))-methyltransferase RlmD [Pantoea sp. Taur]MDF7631349.1 23S rRNA (uracil(1939)-C(5))-methyltransferase RlmD [Erwiniaceae bacterium L1_55_4]MXP59173.1 23S rRNA (uracil(1939)-C(5))-methyltransferase RlmD [Pantoea sp. Taur]